MSLLKKPSVPKGTKTEHFYLQKNNIISANHRKYNVITIITVQQLHQISFTTELPSKEGGKSFIGLRAFNRLSSAS